MEYLFEILGRVLLRWFAPRPSIRKEHGVLVIESTWRTGLFTLGGRHRRVVVDPVSRVVRLTDRSFWFFMRSRRIEFDWIAEVFYTYNDLGGNSYFSHFAEDLFCVGLKLRDSTILTLFRFFGQGEFVNNSIWPDWMMWDNITVGNIASHGLESESQHLADVLCSLTGAELSNSLL